MKQIPVLIVEDDPTVGEIHQRYLATLGYFILQEIARNGETALDILAKYPSIGLVVLDIYMPKMDGMTFLQTIRQAHYDVDVIAVTAASEPEIIQDIFRWGVFDYLVKPFTFERYITSLESYYNYATSLGHSQNLDQNTLDALTFRQNTKEPLLPKGLHKEKLQEVLDILQQSPESCHANYVATKAGVSRVTARRYLEYLVASGRATTKSAYQQVGRPIKMYCLLQ